MGVALDPEIAAAFAAAAGPTPPQAAKGDWRALRQIANATLAL